MFSIFFSIRQIAIEYSMLYIIYCKNVTRQLSSAARIMRGLQHFKTASQFVVDQTLRGLRFHGPGPELATEFFFLFFFLLFHFCIKKPRMQKTILKRFFYLLCFPWKQKRLDFLLRSFLLLAPFALLRGPGILVHQLVLLCCSFPKFGYVLESVGKQQKEK